MSTLQFGIDRLLTMNPWPGQRLALVTNAAATTTAGIPARAALLEAGFRLTKLFSPEHGLGARGEDGAAQPHGRDALTGLPVISLYGDHLQPTDEDLEGIDRVLFDIPDIGCRFYTYLWTLTHVMEACARHAIPLTVLDRPNPSGGDLAKAEGPWLDEARCSSFIGRWNIPVRHSCTLGELARYFAATRLHGLQLDIIPVENWKREQSILQSPWPFVPPSPAITDPLITLFYPGLGLMEGINVNEGRGTPLPFTVFGAPWLKQELLLEAIHRDIPAGCRFESLSYVPQSSLFAGTECRGLRVHITDEKQFRPVRTGLLLIHHLLNLFPEQCAERLYPTVANPSGTRHLDRLTGLADSIRLVKENGNRDTGVPEWAGEMAPYLLY